VIADVRVHQAAERYARLGEVDRRAAVLREATRRFPDQEGFWVELLELEMDRGRCHAAAAIGREATARLTDRPRLYAYYGFASACSGDIAAGRAAFERSLELDPQQPQLREALARLPR
jgi:predicted Zn-dependent protease